MRGDGRLGNMISVPTSMYKGKFVSRPAGVGQELRVVNDQVAVSQTPIANSHFKSGKQLFPVNNKDVENY